MSKPVELLVACELHDYASRIESVKEEAHDQVLDTLESGEQGNDVLRHLLCTLAHNTSMSAVRKALSAVGAPSSGAELKQRLRAVMEQRKAESNAEASS